MTDKNEGVDASFFAGFPHLSPVPDSVSVRVDFVLTTFGNPPVNTQNVLYRTVQVDGLSIFYREAGPKDAPTILLLHGFPSSSRMFEPLFVRLSDRYHMVAPDYPGFGHSGAPQPADFAYTFDHIATVIDHFTQAVGLTHYSLYMQDYGGPGWLPARPRTS